MTDPPAPTAPSARIRRLLVALDASAACVDALDELTALAAGLRAEMQGLIVEDTDLVDLGGYQIVAAYPTSTPAALDAGVIERTLRRHVDRARRAVEAAAGRGRVTIRVEVQRGRTAGAVVASAAEDDLIVIARQARGFTVEQGATRRHVGAVAREVIRDSRHPVFLVGNAASLKGPVYVVVDGSPAGRYGLELAGLLARATGPRPLVVLVAPDVAGDADPDATLEQTRATLGRLGVTATYETLTDGSVDAVCERITRRAEGIVVVAADRVAPLDPETQDFLERIGCSVLIVRDREFDPATRREAPALSTR